MDGWLVVVYIPILEPHYYDKDYENLEYTYILVPSQMSLDL